MKRSERFKESRKTQERSCLCLEMPRCLDAPAACLIASTASLFRPPWRRIAAAPALNGAEPSLIGPAASRNQSAPSLNRTDGSLNRTDGSLSAAAPRLNGSAPPDGEGFSARSAQFRLFERAGDGSWLRACRCKVK